MSSCCGEDKIRIEALQIVHAWLVASRWGVKISIGSALQALDEGVGHVTGEVSRMLGSLWGSAVSTSRSLGQEGADQEEGIGASPASQEQRR